MPATLAAVPVTAMTGTASPSCRPLAEAKNAPTEAMMQVRAQGLRKPVRPWAPTMPEVALMATSETPNRMPAAAPSMKP